MPDMNKPLAGIRVLAALNGLELFGHERGNIEAFKTFRDQGAEVMIGVNAKPDNHVKAELHRLGFDTFDLPFGPQWSIQWVKKEPTIALTNVLALLRCSWLFHRAIRTFRASHVHLGSPLTYSYVSLALALSRVRLIYRMGDCPPVDSPFNLQIWRMAIRRASWIVANSRFVRASALAAGVPASKISVIHNLAPSSATQPAPANLSKEKSHSANLIYVGAISEHKGLIPLIEAFSRLAIDFPMLRLDILGGSRYDAPFRERLQQMVVALSLHGRVFFHGHQGDPSAFFKGSLIHVAPALWEEPFANVVLEAKREATPSVVFPSGGLPEMVRHQVDGYICRDKSVDALEEGLRWTLSDLERLARMGAAAREDSATRFGRERFAREWANVYSAN